MIINSWNIYEDVSTSTEFVRWHLQQIKSYRIMLQEFGDAGCMDAAYALGLWRAGSSFGVVQGATLTSTALSPSQFQVRNNCTWRFH